MNKRVIRFILLNIALVLTLAGLILAFIFKFVATEFVVSALSFLFSLIIPPYVKSWGDMINYSSWTWAIRDLMFDDQITKDTDFRISYGYLYRVCVNGKYFLITDDHKISNFKVCGGTYKITDEEKRYLCDKYRAREDDQYNTKAVKKDDYRLIVPAKNLNEVYKKFSKAQKEDISEMFVKILVEDRQILPGDIFDKVSTRFIRRDVVIKFPKHFKYFEMVLADIYEVTLNEAQKNFFIDAMEEDNDKDPALVTASDMELTNKINLRRFRFATVEEIMRRGVRAEDNQLTATISDHSYKVLPNLPKRKTPIEY